MVQTLVQTEAAVTLVGAGAPSPGDIRAARALAPTVVAADGGAERALDAGIMPDWVIGDMDSLPGQTRERIAPDRILEVAEQHSTDFEKCLSRIDAPLVLAPGFLGARIDHALANFTTLVRHDDRPCILIGDTDIVFAAPPTITLDLTPGCRVSLYPMRRLTGRSEGLEWPIGGLDFSPDGTIGTSNRATGRVSLTFYMPGMLIILPRAALEAAIAALRPG